PEKPKPPAKAAPKPAAPPVRPRSSELTEEELWSLAVDGAEKLADRTHRIKPAPQPLSIAPAQLDPELEAYDELRALVVGDVSFDIADSDEFIEGHARGLDPNVLRRLKRAEFAVQAHLDLHGMMKDEARIELEAFL